LCAPDQRNVEFRGEIKMSADRTISTQIILRKMLDNIGWLILLLCLITFSLTIGGYFSVRNFINIVYHSVFIGLLAIAESYCLISGNLDLSIESVTAFSAILSAWLCGTSSFASGLQLNPLLMLVFMILMGGIMGVINAFFIVKLRIHAFLVTFSTFIIIRGIAVLLTNGQGVSQIPASFTLVDRVRILTLIPPLIFIMLLFYVVFHFILKKTRFGRHIYIIGGNVSTAYNFGVKVNMVLFIIFIFSGAISGLTGWLVTARAGGATPAIATGFLFETLAAVVIGGVSLNGGFGSLIGVFAGVLILSSIRSALNILAISPFVTEVVRGLLVLVAIVLDSIKRMTK
jgi:ribose transport system permease protein